MTESGMFIDQFGLWVVDSGEQVDFVDFSRFKLGFSNDIVIGKEQHNEQIIS